MDLSNIAVSSFVRTDEFFFYFSKSFNVLFKAFGSLEEEKKTVLKCICIFFYKWIELLKCQSRFMLAFVII